MATAIPVIGGREVILTAGAAESGYRNALGYSVVDADGVPGPDKLVFADDDAVAPGTRFDLGAFPAGSRLEFFILQDGGARLVGDGQAWATAAGGDGFAVAFEDLLADAALNPGGLARDGDFNDVVFTLSFGTGPAVGAVRAVFGADDGVHGTELWITDGTAEGTRLLRDINPGAGASFAGGFAALGDGRALFTADDGVHGGEPWITDGTAEGTRLLRDIDPRAGIPGGSLAGGYTPLGDGRVVFVALDPVNSREPWVTDGTTEGTRLLRDIVPGTGASDPGPFTALGNGRVLFPAADPVNGREPWITDGTAEGTRLLLDLLPGTGGSFPFGFTALGDGRAVFSADDGLRGREPWVTDGTAEGTRLLSDIGPGTGISFVGPVTALGGGRALFVASHPVHGREPWITDGTAEGTRLLRDINPGPGDGSSAASGNTAALGGGRALLVASDGVNGFEPWVTDGTAEGTRLLLDITSGTRGSDPRGATALGDGRALFEADDGVQGREPWLTDGTAEGTRLLRDITPGPGGSDPRGVTALGDGRALFGANDGAGGPELWITDGTAEGTRLLRDINPGPGRSLSFPPQGSGAPPPFALLETGAQASDHPFV